MISLHLRSIFDLEVYEYTKSLIAGPVDVSCSLLLHLSHLLPAHWVRLAFVLLVYWKSLLLLLEFLVSQLYCHLPQLKH